MLEVVRDEASNKNNHLKKITKSLIVNLHFAFPSLDFLFTKWHYWFLSEEGNLCP